MSTENETVTETTTVEPTNSSTESTTAEPTENSEGTKPEEQSSNEPQTALSEAATAEGEPEPKAEEPKAEEPEATSEEPEAETSTEDDGYELELSDDSILSQEDLDAIATEAAEKGYTKEQAEAVIKQQENLISKGIEAQNKYLSNILDERKAEFDKDPDFGGEKRAESFASIKRVTDAFGSPELTKALNDPFIGNNLAVAKFLKKLGDAMGQDKIEGTGTAPKGKPVSSEEVKYKTLYPNFFK